MRDLLDIAITILAVAVLLNWAWSIVKPLLPLLVFGVLVAAYFKWRRQ